MGNPQPLRFRDIYEFLDFLPDEERILVDILRQLVHDAIPQITEKLSYNVPYFSRYGTICFIWPASVPWGKVVMKGVSLGFTHGNLLDNSSGYLEQGGRKQVYTHTFFTPAEVETDMIKMFLLEAVEVDEALFRQRKTHQRK